MSASTTKRIVINGKEYSSRDEMPPEIRALYDRAVTMMADEDANGVPDMLEPKGLGATWQSVKDVWALARDARGAGVRSVELPDGPPASITSKTGFAGVRASASWSAGAPSAERPRPAAPAPQPELPPGPTPVGGSGKLALWVAAAVLGYLALRYLGMVD